MLRVSSSSFQEVELHEEPECQRVFSLFIEYLYTCHVTLGPETALPVLVLADKYNVDDLRDVCIRFARAHVIPKLQLKDVFHVWFQYATRSATSALTNTAIFCTFGWLALAWWNGNLAV